RGRLSKIENQLLHAVAVFRTPAPKDAWIRYEDDDPDAPDIGAVLEKMLGRQILQEDGVGGVFILPSLREIVYNEMSIEQREQFHMNSAGIYAMRGEYTEAAWHLMRADRPELAVQLWYPERENEVQRGNGAVALKIFEQISVNRLQPKLQKQLAILRAELNLYNASNEKAIEVLEQVEWESNEPISVEAFQQWGRILESMGETEEARNKFSEGIEMLSWLLEKNTQLHVGKGYLFSQDRLMDLASSEADLAIFHAEILQGHIQDGLSNFDLAVPHFQRALSISKKLDNQLLIARAEYQLGIIYTRQENFEMATLSFNQAIMRFEKLGNSVQEMRARTNFAAMLMNSGRNSEGISEANKALHFFEKTGADIWIAHNANNIADAYLELENIDQAELYAKKVISQEEPSTYGYGIFTFGDIQRRKGNFKEAVETLKISLSQALRTEDRYLTAYCYQALGEAQIGLKDSDKALEILQEAKKLFTEMDIPSELEKTQTLIRSIS
ncbi:MAG: tetratricopeptide repeat protein, partial [Anaerolineae bacterium]